MKTVQSPRSPTYKHSAALITSSSQYLLYFLLFFLSICLSHTVRLQDIWTELTHPETQRYQGRKHTVLSAKDHSFTSTG